MAASLNDLITVAGDDAATADALSEALARAQDAAAFAQAECATAAKTYEDGLLGDEKALAKLAAARQAAETYRDRTAALVAKLTARRLTAVETEAETARRVGYESAEAKRDAAAARFVADYPDLVTAALGLLRTLADADASVEAANADLPAGAEPLIGAEMLARTVPGSPREEIGSVEVELWCREGDDQPIAEEFQSRVISQDNSESGNRGYYSTGTGQHFFRRRRFCRVSYRAAVPDQFAERLANALDLPPLRPGEALAWPHEDHFAASPRRTLSTLDAIAAGAAVPVEQPERPVIVTYLPIDDGPMPGTDPTPMTRAARMHPNGERPYRNLNAEFTAINPEIELGASAA